MLIAVENPGAVDMAALLEFHLANAHANSPPGTVHALGMAALQATDVTFWTARDGNALLGFGALKELDSAHGEVKSMRTAPGHERKGVGAALLGVIIAEGRERHYARLSLETGNTPDFAPARRLYLTHGFTPCGPFEVYSDTSFSQYMTLEL